MTSWEREEKKKIEREESVNKEAKTTKKLTTKAHGESKLGLQRQKRSGQRGRGQINNIECENAEGKRK